MFAFAGCGGPPPQGPTATPAPTPQVVTINGYDPASGADISPINLWDNYQTRRKVTGRVKTGDQVTVLQRSGHAVLVQAADGTQGWLTDAFIKEFR